MATATSIAPTALCARLVAASLTGLKMPRKARFISGIAVSRNARFAPRPPSHRDRAAARAVALRDRPVLCGRRADIRADAVAPAYRRAGGADLDRPQGDLACPAAQRRRIGRRPLLQPSRDRLGFA